VSDAGVIVAASTPVRWGPLLAESVRAGTIAALAIVPLAPLFRAAGLRIGHYGPKFAALFFDDPQPWLLFLQHLVIGWVSALPLLLVLLLTRAGRWPVWTGAAYGAGYYLVVNSLALPLYFGDALPWQLGAATVLPSLVGHVAFGAVVALAGRRFLAGGGASRQPTRASLDSAQPAAGARDLS
jgi:uncharacterized membrane protein YagU involved in acid resistance